MLFTINSRLIKWCKNTQNISVPSLPSVKKLLGQNNLFKGGKQRRCHNKMRIDADDRSEAAATGPCISYVHESIC